MIARFLPAWISEKESLVFTDDLKEERNALRKYVFPRLRELWMQHGCRFQAIDLRWGVSEDAALDE
jgi:hypothetical protein